MDEITQMLENGVRCTYFEAGVHIKNPFKNSYQDGLCRTTQTLDHVVVVHILIETRESLKLMNIVILLACRASCALERETPRSSPNLRAFGSDRHSKTRCVACRFGVVSSSILGLKMWVYICIHKDLSLRTMKSFPQSGEEIMFEYASFAHPIIVLHVLGGSQTPKSHTL